MAKYNALMFCWYCDNRAVFTYFEPLFDDLLYVCEGCRKLVSEEYETVRFFQVFNGKLYKGGRPNGQVWVFGFQTD